MAIIGIYYSITILVYLQKHPNFLHGNTTPPPCWRTAYATSPGGLASHAHQETIPKYTKLHNFWGVNIYVFKAKNKQSSGVPHSPTIIARNNRQSGPMTSIANPIMTPASWLRSSSTRRPYSNMFSEMSGGKSMNICIKIVSSSIQMGISMLLVYATSRALRSKTSRAQRSKHRSTSETFVQTVHPTSHLRKSRSHMLRSFNHSYTKGLSHHGPGMPPVNPNEVPRYTFFLTFLTALQVYYRYWFHENPWILSGDFTLCWTWP